MKEQLDNLLKNKSAKICIVGLGYVGLPLALTFAEAEFFVYGIDIDEKKIEGLQKGISYFAHIESRRVATLINSNKLVVSSSFECVTKADAIIVCVPTPLTKYREPDLSYVTNTISELARYLRKGQILSLESTTYPGTTEEVIKPSIVREGFTIGKDFFLIYSPEREDPGNTEYSTVNIPKIIGGSTDSCTELGLVLYSQAVNTVVPVSSTQTAEMTKLLENIHRAVNIGLINEMKVVAERMNIDLYEVIRAAATKPFGFVPYYPGPGLGGHCIPIDPFYLTWKAREFGVSTRFIELAGEVNTSMPSYVVSRTADALNSRSIAVKSSRLLVLGLAYKKNIDDMRESPSVEIIHLLLSKGAHVDYSDPYIPVFPEIRKYSHRMASTDLDEPTVQSYQAVILATDHDVFDYEMIKENAKLIIDTRGRFKLGNKIVRA